MDRAWMREKPQQCLEIVRAGRTEKPALESDPLYSMRVRAEPTVLEIFRTLDPDNRFLQTEEDYTSTWKR